MKQVKIVGSRLATAFVAVILLACLPACLCKHKPQLNGKN